MSEVCPVPISVLNAPLTIRAYDSVDRTSIRDVCCETGIMGNPIGPHWGYKPTWADAQTKYYTDEEPESALVVVNDDKKVVGFLLGCVDSPRQFDKQMEPDHYYTIQGFTRGLFMRPSTAPFIWRALYDKVRDQKNGTIPDDLEFRNDHFPAHLHIDLLPEARGKRIGTKLVSLWLQHLERREIPGCYLQTVVENPGAVKFFESVGFQSVNADVPVPGLRVVNEDGRMHLLGQRAHLRTMGIQLGI